MQSTQPATVVIACPHCGTRYQLPPETLGERGRNVACAHCGKAWMAEAPAPGPDDDRLFTPGEEDALDRQFTAAAKRGELTTLPGGAGGRLADEPPPEVQKSIAEIKAAIAPRMAAAPKPSAPEPAAPGKPVKPPTAERRPGRLLARLYPLARTAAVLLLLAGLGAGLAFRTEIVRVLPDLAGVYAAIGMPVNVVGLEFSDVTTLAANRGAERALTVTAKIRAVGGRRTAVPPVVVTLLDADGARVYEWSVNPPAPDVAPGEVVELSAELASPPEEARQVRLSFAAGRTREAASPAVAEFIEDEPTQEKKD